MVVELSKLKDYEVSTQLSGNSSSAIYKGTRISDSRRVVIKALDIPYPTDQQLLKYKLEYQVLRTLDVLPGVVKVFDLLRIDKTLAIVMEEIEGVPLSSWIKKTFEEREEINDQKRKENLITLLKLFSLFTEVLIGVHNRKIVHTDICPGNIIWRTESVKLIDFDSAFNYIQYQVTNVHVKPESMPYASPEIFGRSETSIDYRTDFYSLGATMYHAFTGRPPFVSDDPLELIHCHIAKEPRAPSKVHGNSPDAPVHVPEFCSKIILKCLAKEIEDRYQSAYAIKQDIDLCLESVINGTEISADHQVGLRDHRTKFEIPNRVYGRLEETQILNEVIDQVFYARQKHVVIVEGPIGIGKTAFVNNMERYIIKRKGVLVKGKYDEFNANRPFYGFLQVASGLLQRVMKGNKTMMQEYTPKIKQIFTNYPAEILEFIPELTYFLGSKVDKKEEQSSDTNFSFPRRLQELMMLFTSKDSPVVVFLDGFQWADQSSVQLLESIFSNRKLSHLLFLIAYRTTKESSDLLIEKITQSFQTLNVPYTEILMKELTSEDVRSLLLDSMGIKDVDSKMSEAIDTLVITIIRKTIGNPLFLNLFLDEIVKKGLINYKSSAVDDQPGSWEWDIEEIYRIPATENTAKVIIDKISNIPSETLTVLKMASCFGNVFTTEDVSFVMNRPKEDIAVHIDKGVEFVIVTPLSVVHKEPREPEKEDSEMDKKSTTSSSNAVNSNLVRESDTQSVAKSIHDVPRSYKFSHDRIQAMIYNSVPQEDRYNNHYLIGQWYRKKYKNDDQKSLRIFDIVDQLNLAQRPKDDEGAIMLAELNYKAGKKAKASSAYVSAMTYFRKGIQLLKESYWKVVNSPEYRLTLNLHLEAFEISYLTADSDNFNEELSQKLTKYTFGSFDRVIYKTILNQIYSLNSEYSKIIKNSVKILSLLDFKMFDKISLKGAYPRDLAMHYQLSRLKVENLKNLEPCKSRRVALGLKILLLLSNASYQCKNPLYGQVNYEIMKLGMSFKLQLSPIAYIIMSVTLFGYNQIDKAKELSEYALDCGLENKATIVKAKITGFFDSYLAHFSYNINSEFKYLNDSYEDCFREGDPEYAIFFLIRSMVNSVFLGHSLDTLQNKFRTKISELLQLYNVKSSIEEYYYLLHQYLAFLKGIEKMPAKLEFWNLKDNRAPQSGEDDYGYYKCLRSFIQLIIDFFLSTPEVAEVSAVEFMHNSEYYREIKTMDTYWTSLFASLTFLRSMYQSGIITVVEDTESKESIPESTTSSKKHHLSDRQKWRIINSTYKMFKQNSLICPDNYLHCYYLLKALRAGLKHKVEKCLKNFDDAISEAEKVRNIRNWAICNEMKGMYLIYLHQIASAIPYLKEALYLYKLWGATAKVTQMQGYIESLVPDPRAGLINEATPDSPGKEVAQPSKNAEQLNLDIFVSLKLAQALSAASSYEALVEKLLTMLLQNSGAQRAQFIEIIEEEPVLVSEAFFEKRNEAINGRVSMDSLDEDQNQVKPEEHVRVINRNSPYDSAAGPVSVVNFVSRMRQQIVLADAETSPDYQDDEYVLNNAPKSILCIPMIVNETSLKGICYLENRLVPGAFTSERLRMTAILAVQAAITIENFNLSRKNEELVNALTKKSDNSKYNMDAPIKRVLEILIMLKGNLKNDEEMKDQLRDIDFIIQTLISNTLFSLDLDRINDGKGNSIDEQTKAWINSTIMSHLAPQDQINKPNAAKVNNRKLKSSSSMSNERPLANRRSSIVPASNESLYHKSLQMDIESWNFSVITLLNTNISTPLQQIGMYVFTKMEFAKKLKIKTDVFSRWLSRVEDGYHEHPYHNSLHAADVLHAMFMLIIQDNPLLRGNLTPLEEFSVLFSASAHDIDHPGTNNVFLIKTNNPLSILYNDASVLESHHSATAFQMTFQSDCDIFSDFEESAYRDFRKLAMGLILSTDMAKHFEMLNKFKTKASTAGIDPTVADDRKLMLEIAIKMADLNNPTRALPVACEWTRRIMEEFFQQGDKEKENNLDVSMFMDRENTNIPKCQLGFIDIFVAPLYDAWSTIVVDSETVTTSKANVAATRQYWAKMLNEPGTK